MRPTLTSDVLLQLFRSAAKWATTPILLSACIVDTNGLDPVSCTPGLLPALAGVNPAVPTTGAELRELWANFEADAGEVRIVDTYGTPCGDATDGGSCRMRLGALESRDGFYELSQYGFRVRSNYQLATTNEDVVTLIDSDDAFHAWLGTIDTAQEASWRAFREGYSTCGFSETGTRVVDAGFEVVAIAGSTCGPGTSLKRYLLRVTPDGVVKKVTEQVLRYGEPNCVVGRRPAGLRSHRHASSTDVVARHFEEAAALECAAVEAFEVMAVELSTHGAPDSLVQRAHIAASDERRHTMTMAALARELGGAPQRPHIERPRVRGLETLAIENVVEGCVRETFGAWVALRQSECAKRESVRAAHRPVAVEEASHAALSWNVQEWAVQRLDARARAECRRAAREAVETLKREFSVEPAEALRVATGLPSADEAIAAIDSLDDALFSRGVL